MSLHQRILFHNSDRWEYFPCSLLSKYQAPPCLRENNTISIFNNGKGIPVVTHKDEKMYVPTMIFGHLLTSSNFNDEEKKVCTRGWRVSICLEFAMVNTLFAPWNEDCLTPRCVEENRLKRSSHCDALRQSLSAGTAGSSILADHNRW